MAKKKKKTRRDKSHWFVGIAAFPWELGLAALLA
jgi:hypothetical protein